MFSHLPSQHSYISPPNIHPHTPKSTYFIHGRDPTGHDLCIALESLLLLVARRGGTISQHTLLSESSLIQEQEVCESNPSLRVWPYLVKHPVVFCIALLPQQFSSCLHNYLAGPALSGQTYRGQPLLSYEKVFWVWPPPPFTSFSWLGPGPWSSGHALPLALTSISSPKIPLRLSGHDHTPISTSRPQLCPLRTPDPRPHPSL